MSRSYCSYDEDWQRRKSVLIRSLFHDIPILSPVDEESNDSYQYAPQEVFPPPDRPYSPLPPLIIEKVPPVNKHDEPEQFYRKLHNKIKKIYLKLFVENRSLDSDDYDLNHNDSSIVDSKETESSENEFVENQDLNFRDSISPSRANFDSIQEEEASVSTDSNKSKGYESDLETVDTEDIDIVNYTASNKDNTLSSEKGKSNSKSHEAESSNEKVDEASTGNEESSKSKESSKRLDISESSEEEETNASNIDYQETEMEESIETDVELDCDEEQLLQTKNIRKRKKIVEEISNRETKTGHREQKACIDKQKPSPEREDSNEIEKEENDEEEDLNNENVDEDTTTKKARQIREPGKVTIKEGEISQHSTTDVHELTKSATSEDSEEKQQSNNVTKTDLDSNKKTEKSKNILCEDRDKLAENVEMAVEDVEMSQSSEGTDYRQITTSALVHFDGSQDAEDRESRVYEDSIKSVILPTRFRKLTISRNVNVDDRIEVLPILEEHGDPKLAPAFDTDERDTTEDDFEDRKTPETEGTDEDIDEEETTGSAAAQEENKETRIHESDTNEGEIKRTRISTENASDENIERVSNSQENYTGENLEEMRSNRQDLFRETIIETHHDTTESTGDITNPQEPTVLTSSSQDGCHKMSEIETSNEMTDILKSIFNESQTRDETSISGRKRKLYVDKSVQAVQTPRVSWEEMRANFFVGTPKIFRLCACNDHVCH